MGARAEVHPVVALLLRYYAEGTLGPFDDVCVCVCWTGTPCDTQQRSFSNCFPTVYGAFLFFLTSFAPLPSVIGCPPVTV